MAATPTQLEKITRPEVRAVAGLVCMGTWDNENAVMENYACVGVRLPHLPVPLGLAPFHFCVRRVWQTQNKKKQRSAWHNLLPGAPFSTRHSAMQKGGDRHRAVGR